MAPHLPLHVPAALQLWEQILEIMGELTQKGQCQCQQQILEGLDEQLELIAVKFTCSSVRECFGTYLLLAKTFSGLHLANLSSRAGL